VSNLLSETAFWTSDAATEKTSPAMRRLRVFRKMGSGTEHTRRPFDVSLRRLAHRVRALFASETRPLALRLAARGTFGLLVPLVLGNALSSPSLYVIGLAAFLLAFGDLGEDDGWLRRLATGSVGGALAAASGVLAGGHPATAALGMFVWGVVLGMAGVYGDGAAAMSLPVAWTYLELGLAAPSHAISDAVRLGALFLGGGAWAIALAWAIKAIEPYAPLAERTAHCFGLLSDYLEYVLTDEARATRHTPSAADGYGPSRETRMRSAIAEARLLAVETRRRQAAASRAGQRLVILIELADEMFSLGAVLADLPDEQVGSGMLPSNVSAAGAARRAAWRELFVVGTRAVARALAKRPDSATITRVEEDLERLRLEAAHAGSRQSHKAPTSPEDDLAEIHDRIARILTHALHLAGGQLAPPPPAPEREPIADRRSDRPRRFLTPLRSCLDRRSVVGRHALRYGLVTAVAVAIDKSLAAPFGYWLPLTVTVVLKPYAGSTLTRAAQRLCGTVAGVIVGLLLLHFVTAPMARAAASAAAFFATIAVLPLNYGLAIFFLSVGVVPFEGMISGETMGQISVLRVLNTCAGGVLALAGGYLLWPTFERRDLRALISAALASMSLYANRVLAAPAGEAVAPGLLETARRQAGLDNTNLQASFQRVVVEPGGRRDQIKASLLAVVTLQRLLVSLNALREIGPAVDAGRPEWVRFRELVSRALADLSSAMASQSPPAAMPAIAAEARGISGPLLARGGRYDRLVAWETERVSWQVGALCVAVGRLAPGGLGPDHHPFS